jgi:heme-degrading monooxygenase HmoA
MLPPDGEKGAKMHARVVTFTGAKDIEAGVNFAREKVLPLLREQKGYRGMVVNADRDGGVFAVLSLWDTAEDRDATESILAPSRQEGAEIIGGNVTAQTFEQLVWEVGESPPVPGSKLFVTSVSMDPDKVDDNLAFFEREVAPRMKASPGFRALRNMMNRSTGEGMVGTAWADDASLKRAAGEAMARRDEATARGVSFGEPSFREVLLVDMP